MMKTQHYGRIVRGKRQERALTIEKASEICNLSDKGLRNVELGDSDPKLSTILNIGAALDMDLGVLNSCKPD